MRQDESLGSIHRFVLSALFLTAATRKRRRVVVVDAASGGGGVVFPVPEVWLGILRPKSDKFINSVSQRHIGNLSFFSISHSCDTHLPAVYSQ